MTATAVLQQTCQYFGGSVYDNQFKHYGNPQVPGLGSVRRAFPKNFDESEDHFLNAAPGTMSGCSMVVEIYEGVESRVAMAGATNGLKYCKYKVILNCYIISMEPYAEDTQDYVYELRDNIIALIRLDRTLGSGGFEAGVGVGFMVGEGGEPWITWRMSQPDADENRTKQYLMIEFDAQQFDQC
jgi:hypothetical protein